MKTVDPIQDKGFSLLEMIIAIALFATIFSTVFLAVPSSLKTMNAADMKSVQARIARGLVAEILLNDWESVTDYDQTHRYYDHEGLDIDIDPADNGDEQSEPETCVFHAFITLTDRNITLPNTTTEPYTGKGGGEDPDMRVVKVQVTNGPNPNYDFQVGKRHRTYSTWISRMNLTQ